MMRQRRQRRGVLLLIVLSLLVLFLLVGLSFMVSASQFNRLAKSAARTETTGMPGHKLADSVMYQLLRGTKNPYSALQRHSLLEDLYGRDYMTGEVTSIVPFNVSGNAADHQVQEIRFSNPSFSGPAYGGSIRSEAKDDYYAGCVLTFLNGNVKGRSTRVLEYKTSASIPFLRIEGVTIVDKKGIVLTPSAPAGTRLRFIINGRPFNGTGAGYNTSSGRLDRSDSSSTPFSGVPLVFLPNYKSLLQASIDPSVASIGGLDEAYDSVDYQNMFLGQSANLLSYHEAREALASDPSNPLLRYISKTGGVTPSFHRPYLLKHLSTQPATSPNYASLRLAASMRPSQSLHPSFTGSNPLFDEFEGPWDVDNDGDGIPDSVWVDAGLSPVSAPDGRLYKPLVAIYTLDMDGRISINAAGSLEQSLAVGTTSVNVTNVGVVDNYVFSVPENKQHAFGTGYGPADMNLNGVEPQTLITSRYRGFNRQADGQQIENIATRSGFLHWLEQSVPGRSWGKTSNPKAAGFPSNDDGLHSRPPQDFLRNYSVPQILAATNGTWEGTPTDYHVRGIPFLDASGNIVWAGKPGFGTYDRLDDPYEIDLLNPTTHDAPFDLADLMTLNRVATSSKRFGAKNPILQMNNRVSNQFTTHSFSIPALPAVNVGRYRVIEGLRRSLREMFAAKIQRVRGLQIQSGDARLAEAYTYAGTLMAPEFERGEKLDINRVLVPNSRPPVTAPAEYEVRELALLRQKAEFARYLFNLLMLFSDTDPNDPSPNNQADIQRLAQWSINVVDFGDADSVMTRFQYDPNPFDESFDPNPYDANVLAGEREIWGMEHPELLLTESLAFHDRRLSDGDPGGGLLADGDDDDLDSLDSPEGSLFVELYCPRNKKRPLPSGQLASRGPEDLYTTESNANDFQRLELSRTIGPTQDPVWRLAITEVTESTQADSPHELLRDGDPRTQFDELDRDRFVYFTTTRPTVPGVSSDAVFYRKDEAGSLLIDPNSYLVVAPDVITDIDTDEIDLGVRYPSPETDPGPGLYDYNLSRFGRATVVTTENNTGLNVSMPDGGYTTALPSDESLDAVEGDERLHNPDDENEIQLEENYRTVLLQRLANPNLPFHSQTNPYLTLDWLPVDLTVFNSEDGSLANLEIVSRERTGRHRDLNIGTAKFDDSAFNPFSAWSSSDRDSNGVRLVDSLGRLNDSMGISSAAAPEVIPPVLRKGVAPLPGGGRNLQNDYAGMPLANESRNRVGGLDTTLSSLVWHNRPYANPYELLLVPATSSARLTAEYSVSDDRTPYRLNSNGAFGHLLNFFESSTGAPKDHTPAMNAHRIFDFVTVPSPFIGTRKYLDSNEPRYEYVSRFREPGKVNANTAGFGAMERIGFDSLLSDDANRPVNRNAFDESLHGYQPPIEYVDITSGSTVMGYYPDGSHPAEKPNPLRSAVAADLIGQFTPPRQAVDATLLRSKSPVSPPGAPIAAGETPQPALAPFQKPAKANEVESQNLALQNPRRNAYFRYRDLMKIGNSITSQSNVFAVWITVGYFEIEPNFDAAGNPYAVDAFHPDGYRYGIEMGSDVGEVVRDRSFYIIDRSIPVAFEPGVNHNVDNAVLLRKQLE